MPSREVELIKLPSSGYYEVTAAKDKIVRYAEASDVEQAKSFHLDTYCFDSNSERTLFWDLLREQRVKKVYFMGMLTHGPAPQGVVRAFSVISDASERLPKRSVPRSRLRMPGPRSARTTLPIQP